jgi:hypothetical protein
MCKFELAIHTATIATKKTTPTNDARFPRKFMTPSGSYHSKAKDPSEVKESTVFFCIDGLVYQVDPGQIENVEVELDDNDAESGKPPCLLIQFTICTFRIFSIVGVSADQFSSLSGAKARFVNLLTADYVSPFPASTSILASPTGSNTHSSSNEPGQKDLSHDISHRCERSQEEKASEDQKIATEAAVDSSDTSEVIMQRCQASHSQARADLPSLEQALAVSVGSERESSSSLRERIEGLLASVPDSVAASFCTHLQLVQAVQTQNKRIHEYHSELDGILQSFWPSMRTKKRARFGNSSGDRRLSAAERRPQRPADECIARTKELMKQHKEAIKAKYSLSLLPNRG